MRGKKAVRLSTGHQREIFHAGSLGVLVTLAVCVLAAQALAHPFHPGANTPNLSSPAFGGLELDHVGTFDYPVQAASPLNDRRRQFVVEQDGQVRVIRDGQTLSRPFIDVSRLIDFNHNERGLLSMAFAPDYAQSRLFYVFYTDTGGDLRIEEFKRSASNGNLADPRSRRLVLRLEHSRYATHNGGQLQFSPKDGNRLYISTGDGGGRYDPLLSGQNVDSRLGKILRIDPRASGSKSYTIPATNPYVDRAGRDEIWHYGLRNPWRFSFDRANGDMAIGDVGQNTMEEVDFTPRRARGANFGWRCFEGSVRIFGCRAPRHLPPNLEYAHEGGASCAVTGGYVVRDPDVPRLAGRYVYGDYCTGALHAATLREGGATTNYSVNLIVPRLTGFGEDAQGRVYMTSRSYGDRPGAVYRLRAGP
jgi:glucose/arabinose dehydrogenase